MKLNSYAMKLVMAEYNSCVNILTLAKHTLRFVLESALVPGS